MKYYYWGPSDTVEDIAKRFAAGRSYILKGNRITLDRTYTITNEKGIWVVS